MLDDMLEMVRRKDRPSEKTVRESVQITVCLWGEAALEGTSYPMDRQKVASVNLVIKGDIHS